MKVDRHGKAKILSQAEIQLLFSKGFQTPRNRALFGICLFTACRIREACTLRTADAYDAQGRVLPKLIIPILLISHPLKTVGQKSKACCVPSVPEIILT